MLERPDHPHDAYAWMDVFRALAATMVAISHVRDLMWRDAMPGDRIPAAIFYLLTGFGHIGVVVFFVLSGFWITRSVMKRLDQPDFWPSYLVDRLARLWIVLLPVIVIGGVLDWYGVHVLRSANYMGVSGAHSVTGPIGDRLGGPELLGAPLFLAAIAVDPLGSNGPLWSLSYEFWYYLWLPALALLVVRRRISVAIVVFGIGFLSGGLALGFVSWLAGSALHFALRKFETEPPGAWERPAFAISLAATLGLLLVARIVQKDWLDPMVAVVFALFLFGLCRANLHFPRFLTPVADFGSLGSFSLYALHFPLAMLFSGWLAGGLRREPSLFLLLETCAVMALLLGVAIAFSRITEARTDRVRIVVKRMLGLSPPAVRPVF